MPFQPNNKTRDLNAWFPECRSALKEVIENEKEAAMYEAEGPEDDNASIFISKSDTINIEEVS